MHTATMPNGDTDRSESWFTCARKPSSAKWKCYDRSCARDLATARLESDSLIVASILIANKNSPRQFALQCFETCSQRTNRTHQGRSPKKEVGGRLKRDLDKDF